MAIRKAIDDGEVGTAGDRDASAVENVRICFAASGGEAAVVRMPVVSDLWMVPSFTSWFRRYFADLS
ncbi:hypothetical protein FHP25_00335 [Vineibacter terrae]|uniref:Uncharacterized protein n=1 Tax=Vineibacter terrae TaxID=2586908 RepID=A0A5C8PVY6_9HYPH|nr:hypothetical protein [Vineibacter terrae]TXL82185.1 hypothetical protein FHP25_00335 [Vineibacter terrae]